MADVLIKLSDMPIGGRAIVREFPSRDPSFLRMREMGLIAGTPITLIRTAPLGDPLEIKLRGYHLTIRKGDAAQILVEPVS